MATLTGQAGPLIGPLTTMWSMPATCTVNFQVCSTCSNAFQGQRCVTDVDARGSPLQDNFRCWPPAAPGVEPPAHPLVGWGFYSPGLLCPTGYTAACSATQGGTSDWDMQFSLRPKETAVGCCPEYVCSCSGIQSKGLFDVLMRLFCRGFGCTNSNGNKCVAIATTTIEAPTAQCLGTDMINSVLATLTADVVTITGRSGTALLRKDRTMSLWAPMFQLVHQSSDVETTPTPMPASSNLPGEESEDVSEGEESQSTDGSEGGLPIPARVGIGIGISFAILLFLAAPIWMFWIRWRRRSDQCSIDDAHLYPATHIHEKDSSLHFRSNLSHGSTTPELYSNGGIIGKTGVYEVSSTAVRAELSIIEQPVELPTEAWPRSSRA